MKWVFPNKHVQSYLKPACVLVAKTWAVLVPICHVVMEEGHHKSKRLSYTAKFKCEVVQCAEKGNCIAAAVFWVDESSVQLLWKHEAMIREREASWKKFTEPKKGWFPQIDHAVFTFFKERHKTGINCILLFLWNNSGSYHFSKIQLSTMNLIRIWLFSPLKLLNFAN
jgi:hypothetical protein